MNIFVAKLDYSVQEDELMDAFAPHGEVSSVKIITDKFTGKSKGFGFVEMPSDDEGNSAIGALDGADLNGRQIVVKEARPREERSGGNNYNSGDRNW